ncbi:MAG: hypothetical protein KA144_08535 [Xanthomonadaceae bacterium]|nr:hypothetical protein [Xanthomonadaceae bacterium]
MLIFGLYGLGFLLLLHWDERNGHDIPKWVWAVLAIPFFWVAMTENDPEEDWAESDSMLARFFRTGRLLYFICAGIFGIALGIAALSLKGSGTLIELFWFALPAGILALIIALALWLYRSRDRE